MGAGLQWTESSEFNQDLGEFASNFVKERIDLAQWKYIDFWIEKACACLFGVLWEVTPYLARQADSESHLFEVTLHQLISSTANHASIWVNEAGSKAYSAYISTPTLELRLDAGVIENRIHSYFEISFQAMEGKNFKADVARSHSLWIVLSAAGERLICSETIRKNISDQEAAEYLKSSFLYAESLAEEIRQLLRHRRSSPPTK